MRLHLLSPQLPPQLQRPRPRRGLGFALGAPSSQGRAVADEVGQEAPGGGAGEQPNGLKWGSYLGKMTIFRDLFVMFFPKSLGTSPWSVKKRGKDSGSS